MAPVGIPHRREVTPLPGFAPRISAWDCSHHCCPVRQCLSGQDVQICYQAKVRLCGPDIRVCRYISSATVHLHIVTDCWTTPSASGFPAASFRTRNFGAASVCCPAPSLRAPPCVGALRSPLDLLAEILQLDHPLPLFLGTRHGPSGPTAAYSSAVLARRTAFPRRHQPQQPVPRSIPQRAGSRPAGRPSAGHSACGRQPMPTAARAALLPLAALLPSSTSATPSWRESLELLVRPSDGRNPSNKIPACQTLSRASSAEGEASRQQAKPPGWCAISQSHRRLWFPPA